MKKKLLLFILPLLLLTITIQAQTKIWDFGGDPAYASSEQLALWPIVAFNAAENTTVEKDNLFLVGDDSGDKFGQIENSGGKTWDAGTADEYTAVNRFKMNGAAGPLGTFLPTYSYLYFPVTGDVEVKVWYRSSSADVTRELYITDGTSLLASVDGADTDAHILSATKSGSGNVYIFGAGNSFNLYKIEVTGTGAADLLLSNNDVVSHVSTNLKAIGNRIYVSNVKSTTDINIYSIAGALVKSLKTKNDMNFDFKSGLYIATIKTFEGEKSVKILTH
ncbi:Por secretion system C-terminal sorting domain-containing protein [Flaviramulus basaltis]|uniref:Por secretion system C-terminal sorting domain-containing protein n=1 Tax=Flaviramulus basaltis TaxID=369401 RepID=A0A1K2IK10_9FLAO|nr:T9SS type A sorting domain-containing protein [Flaviramulus basaltis]SFZ92748.1 Por secretion system C-terminal sorting domain-containing protein [Flaviramulus basaltis]